MDHRAWRRWVGGVLVIALLVMAGVYVYDLGVAHGLAESGPAAGLPGGGPFIGWWRPWGFGFGFFPFVLLWFLVVRGLFWRRPWYGRRWYGGWSDGAEGVPPAFEEWNRRAHQRQEPPGMGTGV